MYSIGYDIRTFFGICCIQRWKPEGNLLNRFCFPNKHYLFVTTISSKNDGHACMEYPWIRYNRIRWKKQHHDHNIKHQQKSPFKDLAVQKYISSTTRFFSPFINTFFCKLWYCMGVAMIIIMDLLKLIQQDFSICIKGLLWMVYFVVLSYRNFSFTVP